mgnify:CR=1 FL=1
MNFDKILIQTRTNKFHNKDIIPIEMKDFNSHFNVIFLSVSVPFQYNENEN